MMPRNRLEIFAGDTPATTAVELMHRKLLMMRGRRRRRRSSQAPGIFGALDSVCSLFEKTMRINYGLFGCSLGQVLEQLHQACLVRIAHRGFTICLNPIRMLDAQVVVNLLLELVVGVDLMMRGRCSGETSVGGTGWSIQPGLFVSALGCETNEFHKRLSVSRLIAPNPRGT